MFHFINCSQSDNGESVDEYGVEEDVFDIADDSDEEEENSYTRVEEEASSLSKGPGVPRLHEITEDNMKEKKFVVTSFPL